MKLNAAIAIQEGLACMSKYSGEKLDAKDLQNTAQEFREIFENELDFRTKLKSLDALVDKNQYLLNVREFCFDLLLVDFLGKASMKYGEDYLESPDWSKIEDETIERGTELLNVLLYLKECEIEKIEPELGDFLVEFLLVEEEEFQEEHAIFEDFIVNQMLMESDYSEIARITKKLSDQSEVKEIFYPTMSFFLNTNLEENEFKRMTDNSNEKLSDTFIVGALMAYKS